MRPDDVFCLFRSGRDRVVKVWDTSAMASPLSALYSGCSHFCNAATDSYKSMIHSVHCDGVNNEHVFTSEDRNLLITGAAEIAQVRM